MYKSSGYLHKLSTFSGIDLKKESDKQKVIKAISKLSDILFTFIPSSITKENIDIIIKMNVTEKILKKYFERKQSKI